MLHGFLHYARSLSKKWISLISLGKFDRISYGLHSFYAIFIFVPFFNKIVSMLIASLCRVLPCKIHPFLPMWCIVCIACMYMMVLCVVCPRNYRLQHLIILYRLPSDTATAQCYAVSCPAWTKPNLALCW